MSDSGTPSSSLRRAVPSDETGNALDHNQRLIFPDSDLNELEECTETDSPSDEIPFTRIYELVPNKHEACNCFIPGTGFSVEVTDVERFGSSRRTEKTCRYTVQISHGPFEWAIKRRYKHFHQLHQELQRYRALLHLQRPARRLKEHRLSMRRERKVNAEDKTSRPPQLPARIDSSQQDNTPANVETNRSSRKKHVENYLQTLLRIPVYRDHPSTLEFLEVSRLSFISKLGPKGIEGIVNKRSGGYTMQHCCGNICFLWSKRYLVLKDSFMLYMKQDEGRISSVLLFDRHFNVHMADAAEVHGGIVIENMSRTLTVKCASYRQALWWLKSVQEFVETHKSPYLQENRHGSFAPPRDAIPVKWYVNAAEYFLDVAYALESAQEEIFITDWWLSPEIYLKRPPVEGNYWRLDYVLKRRAEAGVRVYVLLYKEVELALGINSGYSKHTLMNAHENIKVIRHPDHVASTVFFWAHHEKLVVIDQTLAFLGGIDLAYGRWDDHQHRLTDVGSITQRISPTQKASPTQEASPIQEASPAQEASPTQEASPAQEASPSQETTSQDPLNSPSNSEQTHSQDESVTGNTELTDGATSEVETDSVPRISAVGAQGWSRLRKVYHTQDSVLRDRTSEQQDAAGDRVDGKDASSSLEGIVHRWRDVLRQKLHREDPQKNNLKKHKMDIWEDYGTTRRSSVELFGEARFWHGKDYCNCVFKDWVQLDKPLDDFIDRHVTPRMPWHDIGVAVQGGTARDVARHFIQRWNFAWTEKKKKSLMTFPKLLPKSLSVPTRPLVQLKGFLKANVQLLRSASDWSAGIKEPEKSIHDAYIDTINNSKHFIYIENQFFVSCADDKTIFNGIGDAITNRIIKAYREKQRFRVYVVVPLLPGFEGDLTTGGGNAIQAVMHFNYRTICRGKYSIVERLKEEMGDMWMHFISFCSLRTHAELGGRPITELIYVHSKMLIADDRTVIIGSANINDRSMLGRRDSELAVVVCDTEFVPSTMDGQPYEAGKFAGSLRNNCFRLVLGLLDQPNVDISDAVSEHFFKDIWTVTAGRNATIFDKVFKCIPSDFILNSEQLECKDTPDAMVEQDGDKARQKLKDVQGFLVQFPLLFLQEENLMPAIHTKEGIMPTELWT